LELLRIWLVTCFWVAIPDRCVLCVYADLRTSCAESSCCWGTMGDHMGPPPGVLGHHSLADALVDDRDHHNHTGSEDDVVVFGDRMKREGYRKGRIYKKGNWTAAEILVLQVSTDASVV
jgi:hypothetical protein